LSSHAISAEAFDLARNSAESDAITVTVVHPGRLMWQLEMELITSCPAIGNDGTIYVVTGATLYDYCYLHAINPDGTYKWHRQLGSEGTVPVIGPDGTIYVSARCPNSIPYLAAINPNGSFKWELGIGISGSPAIGNDGSIYTGQYDGLKVYNPDGTLRWHYTLPAWAFSPAIAVDGTIYVGCQDGYLYALNPDATLKWQYPAEVSTAIAIGVGGSVHFGTGDYLYALNSDGTLRWRYHTQYRTGDPVIGFEGFTYSCAPGNGGYIHIVLDPTGTLIWSGPPGSYVNPDYAVAVAADSTIYFVSDTLYALTLAHDIKWYCSDVSDATLPLTISDDGTIYIVSSQRLYAVSGAAPLADTPWPKVRHDARNTGRQGN
jgi:outer membrane protein assembly factor BamB